MELKFVSESEDTLVLSLSGRVDAVNAETLKEEMVKLTDEHNTPGLTIDAMNLEYISSAGLRALLFMAKRKEERIKLINVSEEIYEIFEVTNFVQILDIEQR